MEHDPTDDDGDCFSCGGEGFVWECLDGFCEDAESGCDLCTRPCPECSPKVRNTGDELGQVLSDALERNKK